MLAGCAAAAAGEAEGMEEGVAANPWFCRSARLLLEVKLLASTVAVPNVGDTEPIRDDGVWLSTGVAARYPLFLDGCGVTSLIVPGVLLLRLSVCCPPTPAHDPDCPVPYPPPPPPPRPSAEADIEP